MTPAINDLLAKIIGQACLRKEIGEMKSISLGFGNVAPLRFKEQHRRYRMWEMGTYAADWEIVDAEGIRLSKRSRHETAEMDRLLQSIDLGRFVAVQQVSETSLRVELDNGLAVNISGDVEDDDEYFHVFCPEEMYIEFSRAGWKVGRSDRPWKTEADTAENMM